MISGVLLDQRTGRPIVDRDLRARLEARGWERVVENLERSRRPLFGLERNPPLFMDVSSAYSGDELGLPYRDIMGEGVVAPTDLAVTGQAGANSVNIAKGACWVVGDTNADLQPTYRMFNDAIVNLGISPDPALARRVHVIAQVTDQGFAGTGRLWALQALHGTPNAAPVLPALPASAISLANILVPAAAANSGAYTFTDLRGRARAGGGGALERVLAKKVTQKTATNTVAWTDLTNAEIVIPPGALGSTGVLKFTAWGTYFQNSGAPQGGLRFDLQLGATSILDTGVLAGASATNGQILPWKVEAFIEAKNATSAQHAQMIVDYLAVSAGATATLFVTGSGLIRQEAAIGGYAFAHGQGHNTAAKDMTQLQALQLFALLPVAHAQVSITLDGATVEIL